MRTIHRDGIVWKCRYLIKSFSKIAYMRDPISKKQKTDVKRDLSRCVRRMWIKKPYLMLGESVKSFSPAIDFADQKLLVY